MPARSINLSIKSRVSRLNHIRKRAIRTQKLQRRFQSLLSREDASSPAQIRLALSLLRPEETDISLVRIGPNNDGGYLVPDDLDGIDALFSPGVSDQIGFDREMAERGIECFMADASVDEPPNLPANIHFRSSFIGPVDCPPFITLKNWIAECAPGMSDLMLQMDIEGAEYDVLDEVSEDLLSRFRVILLELHDLERLAEAAWRDCFARVLAKLNSSHILCHLHSNNTAGFVRFDDQAVPQVVELTYLRADRAKRTGSVACIPHPLDQPCSHKLPEIPSSHFWQTND